MTRNLTKFIFYSLIFASLSAILSHCASTEILDFPRTTFIPEESSREIPEVIWTSRVLTDPYDYLGTVKSKSLSYQGALERLVDGAKGLKADAIVDVKFQKVGFLNTMQAFAIKFRR